MISDLEIESPKVDAINEGKKRGRPRKPVPEVVEPKEPKQRARKKEENPPSRTKQYFAELYHKKKQSMHCDICDKTYISRICFLNHQKNNKNCLILQLIKNKEDNTNEIKSLAIPKFKKLLDVKEDETK